MGLVLRFTLSFLVLYTAANALLPPNQVYRDVIFQQGVPLDQLPGAAALKSAAPVTSINIRMSAGRLKAGPQTARLPVPATSRPGQLCRPARRPGPPHTRPMPVLQGPTNAGTLMIDYVGPMYVDDKAGDIGVFGPTLRLKGGRGGVGRSGAGRGQSGAGRPAGMPAGAVARQALVAPPAHPRNPLCHAVPAGMGRDGEPATRLASRPRGSEHLAGIFRIPKIPGNPHLSLQEATP